MLVTNAFSIQVTLPDFFLGDQLTSQVQALRSIQFYICYYGWGDFKQRQNTCRHLDIYKSFLYIVAVIPYLSRLLQVQNVFFFTNKNIINPNIGPPFDMFFRCLIWRAQCMRRMIEERSLEQGYNGVKYLLTIIAVCLRTASSSDEKNFILKVLAGAASVLAAVFCTYWDFVHDWGLLNKSSKNRWLRDKLLVPNKKVYFIAMVSDIILIDLCNLRKQREATK